jgi:hypothetical protein
MPLVPAAGYPYSGAPSVPAPEGPLNDYQNIRAEPEQFGAQIGRALQGAGSELRTGSNELAQSAIQTQHLYNQILADKAQTDLMKFSHTKLYGDPTTGEVGLLGLHGEAAMRATSGVTQDLDAFTKQIGDSLPNARARLEFNEYSRRFRAYTDRDISAHYEKEMQIYGQTTQKATAQTAAENAGLYFDRDDQFKMSLQMSDQAWVRYAQGQGFDPGSVVTQKFVNDGRDAVVKARVEGYLAHNDYVGAKKFLNDNQNLVTNPKIAEELNKAVHDKAIHSEAINLVFGPGTGKGEVIPYTPTSGILTSTGMSAAQYDTFRGYLAARESGSYSEPPNKGGYMGRYQMGMTEIQDSAKRLGVPVPTQQQFLADPQLQEKLFENYTLNNNNQLMNNPRYAGASPTERAGILAGAHLGGVAGVSNYLATGKDPADSNGTHISSYVNGMGQAMGTPGASLPNFQQKIEQLRSAFPNPEDFAKAVTAAESQQRMLNIDRMAKEREATELNEKTSEQYMGQILKPGSDLTGIQNQIAADVTAGKLKATTGKMLVDAAEGHLAGDVAHATSLYGKGFWPMYQRLTKPLGDPERVNAVDTFLPLAGPGVSEDQAITLKGVEELTKILTSKKTVEGEAEAATQTEMFKAAHAMLTGGSEKMGIKDPKGEDHFRVFQAKAFDLIKKYKMEGKGLAEISDLEHGPLAPLLKPGGGLMRTIPEITADMYRQFTGEAPTAPVGPAPPIAGVPAAGGTIKYDRNGNRQ